MNYIIMFLLVIVNYAIINNVILSQFYGICPFLGVSKRPTASLGMGVAVISTSKGLMSDRHARKENLGGEVICYIW